MNERVRQKLSEIIQRHGRDICGQPKRCKGLLLDYCAGDRREVFVLVSALEEQVVGDLLEGLGGRSWGLVASRLVRRLVEHRAMAEVAARWAVESWAVALGLISEAELIIAEQPPRERRGKKPLPVAMVPAESEGPARSLSGLWQTDAPDVITSRIGQIRLKLIPPGELWMGSPDSDSEASDDERPQHGVRISQAFYLSETPVNQAQYKAVMGQNPSHFQEMWDHPVETVTWLDAVRFCNKLSRTASLPFHYAIRSSGRVHVLGGAGYRLPTEAEWEYACRAGTETRYCFGDGWAPLGSYGWYSANSQRHTCPVKRKRPNDFGLYDMHGNVWEWCWDGYHPSYYRLSPDIDPRGYDGVAHRVARGGSWNDLAQDVRSANRYKFLPTDQTNFLGFRVARGMPDG